MTDSMTMKEMNSLDYSIDYLLNCLFINILMSFHKILEVIEWAILAYHMYSFQFLIYKKIVSSDNVLMSH